MIKMFATDLDGTLLNKDHHTDEIILDTVDSIINKDRVFVIATGRPIEEVYDEPGFKDKGFYVVSSNGSQCYDNHHKLMFSNLISKEFINKLMDTFPDYTFEFCDGITSFTTCDEDTYLTNYFTNSGFANRSDESKRQLKIWFRHRFRYNTSREEIVNSDICKINVPWEVGELKLKEFLKDYPEIIDQPSDERIYELTTCDSTKGLGVLHLAELLNINKDEIATFGDGENDASMHVGIKESYAPYIASDKAINTATYHLTSDDEHAVCYKMREILERE